MRITFHRKFLTGHGFVFPNSSLLTILSKYRTVLDRPIKQSEKYAKIWDSLPFSYYHFPV